jgi:hypothetical protein
VPRGTTENCSFATPTAKSARGRGEGQQYPVLPLMLMVWPMMKSPSSLTRDTRRRYRRAGRLSRIPAPLSAWLRYNPGLSSRVICTAGGADVGEDALSGGLGGQSSRQSDQVRFRRPGVSGPVAAGVRGLAISLDAADIGQMAIFLGVDGTVAGNKHVAT